MLSCLRSTRYLTRLHDSLWFSLCSLVDLYTHLLPFFAYINITRQFFYVALLSYTFSTSLMKLCLLTQYLRVFDDNVRARRLCWFFIVVCALWGVAFSAIALVPCVPLSGFWNFEDTVPRCYGFGSRVPEEVAGTFAAHVASNVTLDLIILAIPIPLYFKTFRQKKQRVGFSCMILLGIA
jgi:hypothetical protein